MSLNFGLSNGKLKWRNVKKGKAEVILKSKHFRVDGKASYSVKDPPDSFLESLEFADIDCYPNIHHLLIIGCVSPIGST